MPRPKDNSDQLALALFTPTVVIPQGDGSVLVKPGKPIQRLTPAEFARRVGLGRNSIYRHIGSESIPEHFVEYVGERKMTIDAACVEHYLTYWKKRRGAEAFVD